jgi:hypothetical protein
VAHYEFEGTGSVAIDSSGNGYDGTIVGAARVAGKYGNALEWNSLDGGDYVLVDDVLSNLTNTVTVTLWQNGNPEMQPQVDYVFDSAPQEKVFRGHIPHGDELIYWDAGGNDYLDNVDRINKAASDPNQYEGQWNHWAFVKNAVTGEMKIYLNGELWQAGTGHFEPIDVTSLTIGSRNDPDGQGYVYNYDGLIDDFRIYDVVLTEAEITNVMNNKVTSAANLNGDDNVNLADLAELTANWLVEVD